MGPYSGFWAAVKDLVEVAITRIWFLMIVTSQQPSIGIWYIVGIF